MTPGLLRSQLRVDLDEMCRRTGWTPERVRALETSPRDATLRELGEWCHALHLDLCVVVTGPRGTSKRLELYDPR